MANLDLIDIIVLVLYFILTLAIGFWSSRRSKNDSVDNYFLGGRHMHWIPVGASIFASNIGSGSFIGLTGGGAASGITIAGYELNAIYVLLLFGWLYAPVYLSSGVYTMPEYLQKRFGGQRIRVYICVLSLLTIVFIKISADLYAGAVFVRQALDWNMYASIGGLLIISAIFTVAGGLTTVIWTDFIQTILMLAGAIVLAVISFKEVGGYQQLIDQYMTKQPNNFSVAFRNNKSCSTVTPYAMNLFRPPTDSEMPGTGMTFGLTVSAVWVWCSDQVIVQRSLSAKNLSHVKGGVILASYLKILPLFLMVFPGMAARVLFTDELACSKPEVCEKVCGNPIGCSNIAYPLLVLRLMPPGATGLMMSVMMAALMTSLISIFNSASTMVSIDIWTRFRKSASETEMIIVGRVCVVILVVVSILWIPIVEVSQGSQLFQYVQSVTSYLSPPICAVYVLAICSERINEKGAFWGLMIGLALGLTRFVAEFSYKMPTCASAMEDPRPWIIKDIHYLHFGFILFLIVCFISTIISYLTKPIKKECLYRLTIWTIFSEEVRTDIDECQQISSNLKGNSSQTMENNFEMTNSTDIIKYQQKKTEAKLLVSMVKEDSKVHQLCAINAAVLIGVISFIWGFYA